MAEEPTSRSASPIRRAVKYFYDHDTHWVTDNVNSVIATAAGSFQEELGCPGDWQPDCLRSWLQDKDGDGSYEFATTAIPAGSYEFKVALNEAWDTSYPGSNVPFTTADGDLVTITYDAATTDVAVIVASAPPPGPSSVTIAGSLQSELGCPGDWQPDCAATHLVYDGDDDVWQGVFTLPAGDYEYKAPLNDSWDENYGAGGVLNGANIALSLSAETDVKFYYDHKTHWVTDNVNSTIATFAGSFQSELGCPGDWQPDCLQSWLQDLDGDGTYEFTTSAIPPGDYEGKVALNEAWDTSYGVGGGGDNVPFTVTADTVAVTFSWDSATTIPTITVDDGGGLEPGDEALVADPVRVPFADEVFYFVMTDRFADGDDTNNARRRRKRRPPASTGSIRPTKGSTTAATCRAFSTTSTTSKGSAPPPSGSRRRSSIAGCRGAAPTCLPGTTGTGRSTSRRSIPTWAPTQRCRP